MRQRYRVGALGCAIVVIVIAIDLVGWQAERSPVLAAQLASNPGGGLVTHVHESEGRPTRVIIVDPLQRVLMVYHVGRDSGEIQLKSVRNLNGDLQLQEFNSGNPSPLDIQKQLKRQ